MKTFGALALFAAQAAAWQLDLTGQVGVHHQYVLKAGEPLKVSLSNSAGTGFTWISDQDWQKPVATLQPEKDQSLKGKLERLYSKASSFFKQADQQEEVNDVSVTKQIDFSTEEMVAGGTQVEIFTFSTPAGTSYDDLLQFAHVRPWLLDSGAGFPVSKDPSQYKAVHLTAVDSFAADTETGLSIQDLPDVVNIIKAGDWVRLILKETPSTGYRWGNNASSYHGAAIRQIFTTYAPADSGLMGASGDRVFVFEINDPSAILSLGLVPPGQPSEVKGYGTVKADDAVKQISFATAN